MVDDLQRHEKSPITMGKNIAYRSVFEKIFLECEVLVPEPEATTPEDGAEGFTEAVARLMAARPLRPLRLDAGA